MLDYLSDIREFDVPYHSRVCIDLGIRVGLWYNFSFFQGFIDKISKFKEVRAPPPMRYLAFDIETTKLPNKFPDAKIDHVMMISIMVEAQAILIINRAICGQDVTEFTYDPDPTKKEYKCNVKVYNEKTEKNLLERFYDVIYDYKPLIITTFNGDFFDLPFMEERTNFHGMNFQEKMYMTKNSEN